MAQYSVTQEAVQKIYDILRQSSNNPNGFILFVDNDGIRLTDPNFPDRPAVELKAF